MSSNGASLNTNIMSGEQVSNIRSSAIGWITPKIRRKIIEFLNAVSFELITDGKCWLRGSGIITVSMHIELGQFKHAGQPQEVKVYSSNNAFYDPKAITEQLADILDEYLLSQKHIARIQFADGTRDKMKESWQEMALSWLILDIGDDPDVLEHLNYSTNDGCKIIVGNAFGRGQIEVGFTFDAGQCRFKTIAHELSKAAYEKYGITLTSDQIERSGKAIGPPIVEIIHDQSYSYPYSVDTKIKLLEMAKYIKKLSGKFDGISTLALAGSVADALDDNLEERLSQAYDLAEKSAIEYAIMHEDDIDIITSHVLSAACSSWYPHVQLAGAVGVVIWDLILPKEMKKEIIKYVTRNYEKIKRFINEPIAKAIVPYRDEHNDNVVALSIKKKVNLASLNEIDAANLKKEIRSLTIKTANPTQLLCYYAFSESQYSGKIIQNARKIDRLLAEHNKDPKDRTSVTKWERFYHDFKQG